jgi:hypothetical protein
MKTFALIKYYLYCLGLSALSLSCLTAGASQTTTTSPSKIYTVNFSEEIESKQGLMFENRVIWFSLIKNGVLTLDKELFARDKASKLPSFTEKYPYQEWREENILRLGGKNPLLNSRNNEVLVSNLSSNSIDYFDVITLQPERFLIFDLAPNTTVKVDSQPESASSSTFLAGGKFSGGQAMKRAQADFRIPENSSAPAHICIIITDQEITINSREYEGVFYDTLELTGAMKRMNPENFSPDNLPKPRENRISKSDCRTR